MRKYVTATITSGTSLSEAINTGDMKLAGIKMSGAWNAANLTFQGCEIEGGTYMDIYDDAGTELSVTAAANHAIALTDKVFEAVNAYKYIKIRSGTSSTPVSQTADREIILVFRD